MNVSIMENPTYSDSNPSPARWFAKRSVWIVVAAVVVVLAGAGVIYEFYQAHQSSKVKSALDAADAASAKGDYQAALNQLSGAVGQASNNGDKVKVYDSLAAAAASKGDVGNAIHYYELKHQLDPSTEKQDAQLLGDLYTRSGQNQQALAQYQIALDWLKTQSQTQQTKNKIQSLQVVIQSLGGQ